MIAFNSLNKIKRLYLLRKYF